MKDVDLGSSFPSSLVIACESCKHFTQRDRTCNMTCNKMDAQSYCADFVPNVTLDSDKSIKLSYDDAYALRWAVVSWLNTHFGGAESIYENVEHALKELDKEMGYNEE